ncbi:MAG TPA: hypothetical protein VHB54_13715 [Mucilaginibacter sp.]|nr:hypothetical protein [Mucilaginibacter sp.]
MDLNFQYAASRRSDEELQERIDRREKYLPDTIEASLAELQNRGHVFTEEELRVIHEDIEAHRNNAYLATGTPGFFSSNDKAVIVEDPDAPSFYSRRNIFIFAFLFGTLFGSIMLAMNINKTANPARMVGVLFFGFFYTIFQAVVVEATGSNAINLALLVIGAVILQSFFWKRYIGDTTFYRVRPIWVPLVIAILLSGLIIAAMLYNMNLKGLENLK